MKSSRILIVEDEAILAAHLALSLNQMGYKVVGQAATGDAAIRLALKEKPDAILMDIRLRGVMSGIEAAETIRKSADIPIIFLTAYTEESILQQAKIPDAFAFLSKPVRDREMRASLEMALYKHGAESQLRRLNQILLAVRDINHLISHERNPLHLLEETCRILARTRSYTLVWIGQADPGDGLVHPLARAGEHADYVDKIRVAWDEGPLGKGPTGTAARERKPFVCRDFAGDPRQEPWRKAALERGFASSAAVPILRGGTLFGVLTVYADKIDFFGEEELALLVELAGDLAFALDAMEGEAARRRAEKSLRQEKEFSEAVIAGLSDGFAILDAQGRHIQVNEALCRMTGFSREELIGTGIPHPYWPPENREEIARTLQNNLEGSPAGWELIFRRKDGTHFPVLIAPSALKDENGRVVNIFATVKDITSLKESEERLRLSFLELRETFQAAIKALSSAIEMRDPYTSGHQERVTRLAVAIARELGLDEDRVEGLRIAAMVHDIGKMSIPAEILSKPTPLTAVEYDLIQTHPQTGFTILENIRFPWPIAQIVLQHHERMDGTGYPNKLAGEKILMEARIIAVADVVEAMSSHRPYRPAVGPREALDEIREGRGRGYDPAVVDACVRIISAPAFSFD